MLPRQWQYLAPVAMGKRYFCDYCDRSFQDNLHNRKKHLNGLQHLKAKKSWYDMFRGGCSLARRQADGALLFDLSLSGTEALQAHGPQCTWALRRSHWSVSTFPQQS